MDNDDVDMLDVLAYNSDALLQSFKSEISDSEKNQNIENHLKALCESDIDGIPDFQKDLDWFNVTEPIRMADLNGKLIILDFFTYCCINCMHVLPDLRAIEDLFPVESGLAIIGVHSAKFENEKDSANLLSAIQRYNITHPVVNDFNCNMWAQLKIKCWPTLFLISPTGTPLLVLMGEGNGSFLKTFVKTALCFYKARGELSYLPLRISPSTNLIPASNLRFPSKICSRFHQKQKCELIAVSDSGNNRILLLDGQGYVLEKIGGNESGFVDGDFDTARFNSPQGLSFLNDDELIIADKENHAIRKINLKEKYVSSIAGTGVQGNDKVGGRIGCKQQLSSPWDVEVYKAKDMDMSFHMDEQSVPERNVVLIAMAGSHQIWAIFLDGIIWWKFKKYEPLTCAAIIGNGLEENRNNSYPQNAAFAQPSGICLFNNMLLIADSESSSIRKASLIDGKVTAVVGGDRNPLNLFAFGDGDGKQFNAKLQHPLGVAYNPADGYLYVADTYNHKIKRVDATSNVIETCDIRDASHPGKFRFSEPDGVCIDSSGQLLYVADTNNHSIQVVDLKTMITSPLELKFRLKSSDELVDGTSHIIMTPKKVIKVNTKTKLVLNITLSCTNGMQLTENAPQKWNARLPDDGCYAKNSFGLITDGKFTIIVDVNFGNHFEKNIELKCHLNICAANACMYREIHTQLKLIYDDQCRDVIHENLTFSLKPDSICLL